VKPDDPLLGCANTVLSPHNAGQTPEVRRDGLLATIRNVESFLAGKPVNVVRA
jgi:glycerate dehydrogenase